MEKQVTLKSSTLAATTATLVPQTGEEVAGDMADKITQVAITFATARDSNFFDVTNREYELVLRRR